MNNQRVVFKDVKSFLTMREGKGIPFQSNQLTSTQVEHNAPTVPT